MLNLLPEIKTLSRKNTYPPIIDICREFIPEVYELIKTILVNLQIMEEHIFKLKKLSNNISFSLNKQENDLPSQCHSINVLTQTIHHCLNTLKIQVKNKSNTETRIISNICSALSSLLRDQVDQYFIVSNNFEEKIMQFTLIESKIINQQRDMVLDHDKQPEMILDNNNKYDLANSTQQYVEARHKEIIKLQQSLQEIHQLFMDMSALVNAQGEVVDRIAFRVSQAKNDVIDGREDLTEAFKIKRRKCIIQ